jgi:hypothetical protein
MMRLTLATTAWAMLTTARARADVVVQIPIDALLNGRPVSTFTDGKVIPWTAGQGLDAMDGLVTSAAEKALGQTGVALPDDGTLAADADHPEAVLHFSNAAGATSLQTYFLNGPGNFQFAVPQATYSKVFLYLTSSYGASPLTVTTTYVSGQPSTTSFMLPDWGTGQPLPTNPPIFFNLISGMHKWTAEDQQVDSPVHTITGVVISPDATRALATVQVKSSATTQDLIFWGATGLATNPIDAGVVPIEAGAVDDGGDAAVDDASDDASEAPEASSGPAQPSGGAGATGGSMASGGAPSGTASGGISAGSASGAAPPARRATSAGCAVAPAPRSDVSLWMGAFAFGFLARRPTLSRRRRPSESARALPPS